MDKDSQAAVRTEQSQREDGRFDALMEAVVDAIIVIDGRGTILEFSKAAIEMFGYEPTEIVGENVSTLMPEPYRSHHDGFLDNYRKTGKPKIIGIGREVRARRKDGSVFPIDLAVGEVADDDEPRFVGIIRDISARKAVELEAREQRERLAHVTRLSTMGEMAAGIAHEVNQPLTAIATYANAGGRLLTAKTPDLAGLAEILEKLSAQAIRAGEVIRRLRHFVKKREGHYEVVSVNELAYETLQLAEVDSSHHDVELTLQTSKEDLSILADTVQIQQVMLNLIRNAIEAEAMDAADKRSIIIRIQDLTDLVRIEIIDHGSGLDANVKENLFMPFQTTKESGMGMGLSISRSIIEAHKGVLAYRANPRGGAIFYFELPTAERGVS